jgi:hypothetical protein
VESKALHADVNYRVVARPYFDTADVLFYAYYVHKKECRPVKMYSVKTGKMYSMIELCTTGCNYCNMFTSTFLLTAKAMSIKVSCIISEFVLYNLLLSAYLRKVISNFRDDQTKFCVWV